MKNEIEALIKFEDNISQMFDSEERIALAVLHEVRKLKKKYKDKI